jgi:hypothetical protein
MTLTAKKNYECLSVKKLIKEFQEKLTQIIKQTTIIGKKTLKVVPIENTKDANDGKQDASENSTTMPLKQDALIGIDMVSPKLSKAHKKQQEECKFCGDDKGELCVCRNGRGLRGESNINRNLDDDSEIKEVNPDDFLKKDAGTAQNMDIDESFGHLCTASPSLRTRSQRKRSN